MIPVTFAVDVQHRLKEIDRQLKTDLATTALHAAFIVRKEAQASMPFRGPGYRGPGSPKGTPPYIRRGRLKASTRAGKLPAGAAEVFSELWYARVLELQLDRPFLGPALENTKGRVAVTFRTELGDSLDAMNDSL